MPNKYNPFEDTAIEDLPTISDGNPIPGRRIVTIKRGDIVHIIPDSGPERDMLVAHVEHHIITLSDLSSNPE